MSALELKPCPFCGGQPVLDPFSGIGGEYYVYCSGHKTGCRCDLGLLDSRAEAIAAWNRRTPPAIRDDENHKATVFGDDNEFCVEWTGRVVLSFSPKEDCGYTIFRDGKWHPGKFKILDEAKQAAEEIKASLRSLIKEDGADE